MSANSVSGEAPEVIVKDAVNEHRSRSQSHGASLGLNLYTFMPTGVGAHNNEEIRVNQEAVKASYTVAGQEILGSSQGHSPSFHKIK